jgi:hypothetical protein
MPGAIVVIVVESPPPSDPVGTALDTFGSIELGSGGAFTTSTASHGLEAGGPWNPGTWIDIAQPSLPETRRKHRVSYVDTGKGFALYRINLRFEGDRKRVPVSVSDVAIELASRWIELRTPTGVYITGPKGGSPREETMAAPGDLAEVTWWTWVPDREGDSGDGVVTPFADGVAIRLADEFTSAVKQVPSSVTSTLGLDKPPRLRLGL